MSPAERQRLAEAMTAATGDPWIATEHSVERTTGERVGLYREDHPRAHPRHAAIFYTGTGSFPYRADTAASSFFGTRYMGRGWMDRFVADAVAAVRGHDVWAATARLSTRDAHRASVYRRILAPDSGACKSEREQARRHLDRMGATS